MPGLAEGNRQRVEEQLVRILASPQFVTSKRRGALLRHLVTESLEGRGAAITEYGLGLDIFERGEDFDPRISPIVRVEMGRLRQGLREYYASTGSLEPIIIEFPPRTYVPEIIERKPSPLDIARPPKQLAKHFWWVVAAVAALILAGVLLWSGRGTGLGEIRIAVLPLADLSPTHDAEYLSDGLTDEISEALAGLPGMRVVARTSAFQFKGKAGDVRTIAQRLHVEYLVEGSLVFSQNRLRVNAQLSRAADGYRSWSQIFDRTPGELLATEQEIANSIAAAIGRRIRTKPKPPKTSNPEAHLLFLKARYLGGKHNEENTRQALSLLDQAIAHDPGYGAPHAAKAGIYMAIYANSVRPTREMLESAIGAARDALGLDDSLADARATLAFARFYYRQPKEAEAEFARTLARAPNSVVAHQYHAAVLMMERRFKEALAENEAAASLDPLALTISAQEGLIAQMEGDWQRVFDTSQRILAVAPNFGFAHGLMGAYYLEQHKWEQAETEFRKESGFLGENNQALRSRLALVAAARGNPQQVRQVASTIQSPAMDAAILYAAIGDRDAMYKMLEAAESNWEAGVMMSNVIPALQRYREEKRFRALLDRLGL